MLAINKNCYDVVMNNRQSFDIRSLDGGMMVACRKLTGEVYLINLYERQGWLLVDTQYKLVRWSHKDIDFDKVNQLSDNHHARGLRAPYGLHISKYHKGLAKVSWILYPGGQYYTSDDGFDITDNTETVIYALIDKKCRIVERFQPDDNWLNQ